MMTLPRADRLRATLLGSLDLEALPKSIRWSRLLPPATGNNEKVDIIIKVKVITEKHKSYINGNTMMANTEQLTIIFIRTFRNSLLKNKSKTITF